jgi:hypothetical protein
MILTPWSFASVGAEGPDVRELETVASRFFHRRNGVVAVFQAVARVRAPITTLARPKST